MMHASKDPGAFRRLKLPRDATAPRSARRFLSELLRNRGVSEQAVENVLLVSSELVTNAYKHGKGEIELRARVAEDRLRLEVIDQGEDQAPAVRQQPEDEVGGWGLQIVDQVALQWGVFEGTTHVWADLALS